MIKVKRVGRKPGEGNVNVPHSAYPEIVRRFASGQELASDIGKDFTVGPVAIRTLVRRCKANPALLVD